MGHNVYANGRAISCKAADGKSIAAFPDVCLSPPTPPAGPLPLPYPNTAMASDTTDGSKTVQICAKEVMLKDSSYFKTSSGDEAATKSQGMGVVTHQIQGKAYFTSWSMDVKIEGENAVRHMDLTTHNHASPTTNTPPTIHNDGTAFGDVPECKKDSERANKACAKAKPKPTGSRVHKDCSDAPDCAKAMECILVPKGKDKERCCSPENTGDHMIEDHWTKDQPDFEHIDNLYQGAPTACVNRSRFHDTHGALHAVRGVGEDALIGKTLDYGAAKKLSLKAHKEAFPNAGCSKGCIEAQLDAFYGDDPDKECHAPDRKQALKPEQRTRGFKALGMRQG